VPAGEGGDATAEAGSATTAGTKTGGTGGAGGSSAGTAGNAAGGVPPDVLARASAIVYYQTSHTAASDNTIQMKLHIKNQSPDPLPMANVKIRYWFTAEVATELHQYYTGPEAKLPKAVFVNDGADSHALMTFGGGSIVMGGDLNASEVQLEITNNTGKFNQADDFSFAPSSATSTPNDQITLYLDDTLIWGCEPSGACFDDAGAGGATSAGGAGAGGAP
jgi:endoglucanase